MMIASSGNRPRQVDDVRQLRMEHPGVERQPELGQLAQAPAEFGALQTCGPVPEWLLPMIGLASQAVP